MSAPLRHGPTRNDGLTLLEVLAAAMIFAMVMAVLIGSSSTAVHRVGDAARRLEANLVADAVLADLEIQMKQGIAPVVDEEETQYEQFAIRTIRTDLAAGAAGAGSPPRLPGAAPAAGAGGDTLEIAAMLGAELPEVAKHLKQYDIEVSWVEQEGIQSVHRTTFAFDWQMAATEFPELFENRSGGESDLAGGVASDDDDGGGARTDGSAFFGDGSATEAEKALLRQRAQSRCDGHNAARNATGCK